LYLIIQAKLANKYPDKYQEGKESFVNELVERNERIIHVGEYGTGVLYHPTELLLNYFHQCLAIAEKEASKLT